MAGMEELEVHSKSYLVRWVHVKGDHTISWSIQPHKKSLNFGIFKHPGQLHTTSSPIALSAAAPPTEVNSIEPGENLAGSRQTPSIVIDKLRSIGLKPIQWIGKCEADRISQGTYDVPPQEGGNYALVFDNTFSKQISKTATFVLLTYPTCMPPQSGHPVHHTHTWATVNSAGGLRMSPKLQPLSNGSTESLRYTRAKGRIPSGGHRSRPASAGSSNGVVATIHTGVLQKRRRKRHQGWARRFFTLDFTSSTLSYYHDRNSSALRGAIPLRLAVVAANAETREISVDSGAEIWHLRANNAQEFTSWKAALEKASQQATEDRPAEDLFRVPTQLSQRRVNNPAEEREWTQVESLVSKVSGSRNAIRRMARDTDSKYLSPVVPSASDRRGRDASPQATSAEFYEAEDSNFLESRDRRPFWKRRQNNQSHNKPIPKRMASALDPSNNDALLAEERKPRGVASHRNYPEDIHEHLMEVLRDLDAVVTEFSSLIAESTRRRHPPAPSTMPSRLSMESDISQEFFDATEGGNISPLLTIQPDSGDEADEQEEEVVDDANSSSGSDVDDKCTIRPDYSSSLFPAPPKSLSPLPLNRVNRRTTVQAPAVPPPSLIGFLRKNVGKDLSAIAMPVSSNEPLSYLQRAAECLEYSALLDKAANVSDGLERLIYVTAFALSSLSAGRVKERAIRKPFNPMLGETYELVREDSGVRFLAEKVSHRPIQLAFQADSKDWSFAQSPMPTQKFWGKSVEVVTEGKVRLTLHTSGERFSWLAATSFLRNIIAGERYFEPVGEMTLVNETTGQKSVSAFKAGGMFSGRSEEVNVKAFDSDGNELPLGLAGNWTSSLQLTEHGSTTDVAIWTVGPLVDQAPKHYGLPVFSASLNQITPVEQGKLAPTDSRLRPDQRALEDGDVDLAEDVKAKLEERQRERRREMEERGEDWKPRWFTRVEGHDDDEVIWRLRIGRDGYWEERDKGKGEWSGTIPVFKL
ncbi:hypothetical protein Egran_04147 [Elaphomyces granulatus]|uniref:PH domain-containing protein n=1 Tax=Elaphomyces granulatus TaxID=519963 RepID=A0A232LVD3_9EURO|nr:hypothetical protein Egran_04147 [Elaphomyces granulatus]